MHSSSSLVSSIEEIVGKIVYCSSAQLLGSQLSSLVLNEYHTMEEITGMIPIVSQQFSIHQLLLLSIMSGLRLRRLCDSVC